MRILFLLPILLLANNVWAQKDVIIFPSDAWCRENGAVTTVLVDGYETYVPDYEKAQNDPGIRAKFIGANLSEVMSTITELLGQKEFEGFGFRSLLEAMKVQEDEAAILNFSDEATGGAATNLSPLDQILSSVKPDVKLDLSYSKIQQGPRFYYQVQLDIVNPFTGEILGTKVAKSDAEANGDPLKMIEYAVGQIAFDIGEQIRAYLDDVRENGQKIKLNIYVSDEAQFDLKDLCPALKTEYALVIDTWLKKVTVNGKYSSARGSGIRTLQYSFVRMPQEVTVLRGEEIGDLFGESTEVQEKPTKVDATPDSFSEGLADFLNFRCKGCNATTIQTGLASTVILGSNR